jgi:hypothetical protein
MLLKAEPDKSTIRLQQMGKANLFNTGSIVARVLRISFPGAFCHVTSRGNERKAVFKSERDREKFLQYLESAYILTQVERK